MKDNRVIYVRFTEDSPTGPCTLEEVKAWCKIDIDDDDEIIEALIVAARQVVEQYTNRSLIDREVTARLICELGNMFLPYGPGVSGVVLKTENDVDITSSFSIKEDLIVTAYDCPIVATYTVTASNNETLKRAVMMQVAYMYENRGDGNISPLAKQILIPYIR